MVALAVGLLAGMAACAAPSSGENAEPGPGIDSAGTGAQAQASTAAESGERPTFAGPVIVFMVATPAQIETRRASYSEEQDFYTMTDDLMWYRAQAHEFLDSTDLAEVVVRERGSLELEVDRRVRRYEFEEYPFLDLIVAYRPGVEPLVVAPVDVYDIARYFAEASPPGRTF